MTRDTRLLACELPRVGYAEFHRRSPDGPVVRLSARCPDALDQCTAQQLNATMAFDMRVEVPDVLRCGPAWGDKLEPTNGTKVTWTSQGDLPTDVWSESVYALDNATGAKVCRDGDGTPGDVVHGLSLDQPDCRPQNHPSVPQHFSAAPTRGIPPVAAAMVGAAAVVIHLL